ncbi:MAG TPA: lipopolysaccharide transport periplasmic protein LptA, partial [Woeseiaceae bacterium]|nr:lipopolysaccharide transport periplasmic protein LptA [Woeseiaceae bacterium]
MYTRPLHALPVLRAALLPALLLLAGPAPAQGDDVRLPVVVDAESTDYDGNASMLHFRGLKLTQGSISIESDEAQSAGRDFDDNTWHLSGNVIFDVAEGHIEADSATLTFTDYQLQVATIEGTPATFELRRPGSEETTHASARRLHYDVADGVIEFTGKAEISEGANRFAAESLVYNIRERRVNAASSGAPEDRVKVIFT